MESTDLEGLVHELVEYCFAKRFQPHKTGADDADATKSIMGDWFEENGYRNLATLFRWEHSDYEGWMVDILDYGLKQAEAWAEQELNEFK